MIRERTVEMLDEAQWLLDGGVWPGFIAARLHTTFDNLAIAARRAGRTRLYARFEPFCEHGPYTARYRRAS